MLILWEGDSLMIIALKIIIAIIVISVFTVGVINVYATEVTVELQPKYDPESELCNEGSSTGDWWCNWKQYPNTSGYTSNQTTVEGGALWWNDEEKKYVTTEEYQEEAYQECYDSLECPAGWFEQDDGTIVNFEEILKEDLQTRANVVLEDEIFKCGYDITLYQDGTQFEVPIEVWIDTDGNKHVRIDKDYSLKAIDLKNYPDISRDRKAVEACFGQWDLEKREHIFGEPGTTITKVSNEDDFQQYHADVAFGITPKSQAFVNAEANKDIDPNLSLDNIICNGNYQHSYKKVMGCFTDWPEGDEPTPQRDAFPEWLKSKLDQYNRDGGKSMATEISKYNAAQSLLRLQTQLSP